MKINRLTLILTCLFMLNLPSVFGGNIIKQDSCVVTFLIDDTQQNGALLKLNDDLFIIDIKMIPKIDNSIISSFMMYKPESEQFKKLESMIDTKNITLVAYFEIVIKDGFEVPEEFKVEEQSAY